MIIITASQEEEGRAGVGVQGGEDRDAEQERDRGGAAQQRAVDKVRAP